jgi:hypothetical protein
MKGEPMKKDHDKMPEPQPLAINPAEEDRVKAREKMMNAIRHNNEVMSAAFLRGIRKGNNGN